MASFDEHIKQGVRNLNFLTETNAKNQIFWDWQVTISFYVAVHIVNGHIAKIANLHYRTHEAVKDAINPFNPLTLCKVNQDVYLCYAKLEGLSRRARYLCHDDPTNTAQTAHFTYDKHFAKAIRNLDKLLDYFTNLYSITYPKPTVKCPGLSSGENLKVFSV